MSDSEKYPYHPLAINQESLPGYVGKTVLYASVGDGPPTDGEDSRSYLPLTLVSLQPEPETATLLAPHTGEELTLPLDLLGIVPQENPDQPWDEDCLVPPFDLTAYEEDFGDIWPLLKRKAAWASRRTGKLRLPDEERLDRIDDMFEE